ncbi:MAG: gliding motility-associated-like protein [Saprospiraceae bacterium]|jgi:gliding motility-associated-like protein
MNTMNMSNILFFLALFLIGIGISSAYWVENFENFSIEFLGETNRTFSREADSLTLVDFYQKTGGNDWTIQWDLDEPMEKWNGVVLNSFGGVKCIDLDGDPNCNAQKKGGNGLKGAMPNLKLPFLEHLFLAGNQLNGQLPNFENLSKLLTLQLCCNHFSGTIPNFEHLARLNSLELDYNSLTGTVPNFKTLSNLENLYLSNNKLEGTIPNFQNLSNLKRLYLHKNQLSGAFPNFSTPELGRLILADNNIEGSIEFIASLKKLTQLNLANNRLNGTLQSLAKLPYLKSVVLAQNEFSGSLPNLDNLTHIVEIDLSNNQLDGAIPKLSSASLKTVLLENNAFNKANEWGALPALSVCSLSGNCLSFEYLNTYKKWLKKPKDYQIQTLSFKDTLIETNLDETLTLNLDLDSKTKSNIYKWYHDDKPVDAKTDKDHLFIEKIKTGNLGQYHCVITNADFPKLELRSRRFIVAKKDEMEVLTTPILENDFLSFEYDESNIYTFDVTENDDLKNIKHLDIQSLSTPKVGMLTSLDDGTFELRLPPGFSGIIDFEYKVCNLKRDRLCDVGIVEIEIEKPAETIGDFTLPGNFSPNSGNGNDTYIITALKNKPKEFTNPQLIVYNRNGQPVYNQKQYQNDWQGTYQESNTPLPMGIYYYQFIWENEGTRMKTGALMLIRQY